MNLSNRIVITSNIRLAPMDVIQPYGDHVALLPPAPDQITVARAFLDLLAAHPQLAPRASIYFGAEQVSGHVVCDLAHEVEALDALGSVGGGFHTESLPDADVRIHYGHVGPGEGVLVALFVYRGEMP